MSVTSVASQSTLASAAATSTAKAKNDPNNLDFLQFLVMQLKNQSPLNPADSGNMMQQMAMMQMVQETRQLRTELKEWAQVQGVASTTGMLGWNATVLGEDGRQIKGTVSGVAMQSGHPTVRIGSSSYPLSQVIEVH